MSFIVFSGPALDLHTPCHSSSLSKMAYCWMFTAKCRPAGTQQAGVSATQSWNVIRYVTRNSQPRFWLQESDETQETNTSACRTIKRGPASLKNSGSSLLSTERFLEDEVQPYSWMPWTIVSGITVFARRGYNCSTAPGNSFLQRNSANISSRPRFVSPLTRHLYLV